MSNFELPRLNFYGKISLDVATGNNGKNFNLYDIKSSKPYMPPRIMLEIEEYPVSFDIKEDETGSRYVEIEEVNYDNYIEWASTPIKDFEINKKYFEIESFQKLYDWTPGSWNFFGSLQTIIESSTISSVVYKEAENVKVLNKKKPDIKLSNFIDGSVNWGKSVLCDVDSIAQLVTQIFYNSFSITDKDEDQNISFESFTKSTTRYLNFFNVINRFDRALMPMSGSAVFYTKIKSDNLKDYFGENVTELSVRFIMTEVYEKHHVKYEDFNSNPASAKIIGTISPFVEGDLNSGPLCRQLNAVGPFKVSDTKSEDKIINSKYIGGKEILFNNDIPFPLASALLKVNEEHSLISLDLINTIPCYGSKLKEVDSKFDSKNVVEFSEYENIDFGSLLLYFCPQGAKKNVLIGTLSHEKDYNRNTFIERGGIYDFQLQPNIDYSKGIFKIYNEDKLFFSEQELFVTTDNQGNYTEQGNENGLYLNQNGENPVTLSVLHRGEKVKRDNPQEIYLHYFENGLTNYNYKKYYVYDGQLFEELDASIAGCHSYILDATKTNLIASSPSGTGINMPKLMALIQSSSSLVIRVLEKNKEYEKYVSGEEKITWEILRDIVLGEYFSIVPYMKVKKEYFSKESFHDANTLDWFLGSYCNPKVWNETKYMPITRNMTPQQLEILKKWREQIEKA